MYSYGYMITRYFCDGQKHDKKSTSDLHLRITAFV